jgi:hypothetical protein
MKEIIERHFVPCLEMLVQVIETSPPTLWEKREKHAPLWQHVMHTLESVDYWFTDSQLPYLAEKYSRHIPFDFTETELETVSQPHCREYFQQIKNKSRDFFKKYGEKLLEISFRLKEYTILDVLLGQIRHIQYHVAYCSSILSRHGLGDIKWLGYGE